MLPRTRLIRGMVSLPALCSKLPLLELFLSPATYISLTLLEIVLGIDNIIFAKSAHEIYEKVEGQAPPRLGRAAEIPSTGFKRSK